MTLNLTLQHFAGFLFAVWVAAIFFKGHQLTRMIAWIALWQLLSPARDWFEDVILFAVAFTLLEHSYKYFTKAPNDPTSRKAD